MKKGDNFKLMVQTAEQLHSSFINDTNLPEKNLQQNSLVGGVDKPVFANRTRDMVIWRTKYHLSSLNSIDARIAKAILQPTNVTYQTYQLMENKKCN